MKRWNLEWIDLERIDGMLPKLAAMNDNQRKISYQKVAGNEDLVFACWVGNFFVNWYANALKRGTLDEEIPLLAADVKALRKLIEECQHFSDRQWQAAYDKLHPVRKTAFRSKLGPLFLQELGKRLVESTPVPPMPEVQKVETKKRGQVWRNAAMLCLFAISVSCFSIWGYAKYEAFQSQNELSDMRSGFFASALASSLRGGGADAEEGTALDESTSDNLTEKKSAKKNAADEKPPEVLEKYKETLEENPQMIGWLKADGLAVDSPVMQSEEDGDFYLTHDFAGRSSASGAFFLDPDAIISPQDKNIIVYGHNMKNGSMFGQLDNYTDEAYLETYKDITFDTIYETGQYEAIALVRTRIKLQNESGFRYYQFYDYDSKKEFRACKQFVRENLVSGEADSLKYGDDILMLSTCEYSQDNGRLVLICRKVDD